MPFSVRPLGTILTRSLAALFGALALVGPVSSQTTATPSVRTIDPATIEPLTRPDTDFREGGPAVHRRIVSQPRDGSVNLDIGYNVYQRGVGSAEPYAYDKDEYCYVSKGELQIESDGVTVLARAGDVMWRPAGAPTERTMVTEPIVGICAFGPARIDQNSHRIPSDRIGKWDGDLAAKPKVRWYDVAKIAPTVRPGEADFESGRIMERRVLTRQRDGVKGADVTHVTLKAGVRYVPGDVSAEQICWLEAGEIDILASGRTSRLAATHFLYRPAAAPLESLLARKDSTLICFIGPARA